MLTRRESNATSDLSTEYRPEIDGLRAISVLSVLFYHYGVSWLSGGFIGVDIFFVISGFLITQKLTTAISSGNFSVLEFYARRARRILPALFVVLTISIFVGYAIMLPGDYAQLGLSAIYASTGLGNVYFYAHTGYFDREADLLPLLHTWSLGVEEQFYFFWPLILFISLNVFKRPSIIACVIGLLAVASFAFGMWQLAFDPKAAFYLPFARAWELGIGALIVFSPRLKSRHLEETLAFGGLVLIVFSVTMISVSDKFPGLIALIPTIGAATFIYASSGTKIGRIVGNRPLRFTGLISYSLYLWHWPLLVFFREYQNSAPVDLWQSLYLVFAAFLLAALSWRYIEIPFRQNGSNVVSITGAFVTIGAIAFTGAIIFTSNGIPSRVSPQISEMSSLDSMWHWDCPKEVTLPGMTYPSCNFGRDWNTPGPKAIIWGDSHAEHLAPIMQAGAAEVRSKYAFLLFLECPAALGENVQRKLGKEPGYPAHCRNIQHLALQALKNDRDIRLVVLSASWARMAAFIDRTGHPVGETSEMIVATGLESVLNRGREESRKFAIVSDTPSFEYDPVPCVIGSISSLFRKDCRAEDGNPSREYGSALTSSMTSAFKSIARGRRDIEVLDPFQSMCTSAQCTAWIDGEFIYRDSSHFRRNLSVGVLRKLSTMLGLTDLIKDDQTAPLKN